MRLTHWLAKTGTTLSPLNVCLQPSGIVSRARLLAVGVKGGNTTRMSRESDQRAALRTLGYLQNEVSGQKHSVVARRGQAVGNSSQGVYCLCGFTESTT